MLYLDWGIGLGLILNGKLYRGSTGFSGEFSHIPMIEDGLLCHCGKHGCIETIASGTAIARMVKEGMLSGKSSNMKSLINNDLEKIEIKLVVDAAFEGDQYAIRILTEVGYNLGKGIAILIQLFNPELIILGGRVSEAGQYITTPIQQALNTYCMRQIREKTEIQISEMKQFVGIMGAVAIVMEDIFENHIKA
jgi:predicted NBD/HSP70 family sugar kinase